MFKEFKKNKDYLSRFHFKSAAVFLVINISLGWFFPPSLKVLALFAPAIICLNSTKLKTVMVGCVYAMTVTFYLFSWNWIYLGYLIGAGAATLTATALLHNASHRSLRPKWLNRPVGELMCLFQLTGFPDWTVVHVFHHTFSDDPVKDPHPPGNQTFWQYVNTVRAQILSVYLRHYFEIFGRNADTEKAVKRFGLSMKLDHFMKVAFWYLALGPQLFSLFFVPSVLLKMFNHAWINYANHRWTGKQNELVNLHTGIYKIGNFFGLGIYYHKNHHLMPGLFDPRKMKNEEIKTVDAA